MRASPRRYTGQSLPISALSAKQQAHATSSLDYLRWRNAGGMHAPRYTRVLVSSSQAWATASGHTALIRALRSG